MFTHCKRVLFAREHVLRLRYEPDGVTPTLLKNSLANSFLRTHLVNELKIRYSCKQGKR